MRALGEGGRGGPLGVLRVVRVRGNAATKGSGVTGGFGSRFSWPVQKGSFGDCEYGAASSRGDGHGVLFAESLRLPRGLRPSSLGRCEGGPRGTESAVLSTKISMGRLRPGLKRVGCGTSKKAGETRGSSLGRPCCRIGGATTECVSGI
jgi:hypothetical protein